MIRIQLAVVLCSTLTHGASENPLGVTHDAATQRAANSDEHETYYDKLDGQMHTRETLFSKTGNRVPLPLADPLALPPDFDMKTPMQKGHYLHKQRKSLQTRERILRNEDAELEKKIHSYYFENKGRCKKENQEADAAEAKQNDVVEQLEAVLIAQEVNKSLIEKLQKNKVPMPPMPLKTSKERALEAKNLIEKRNELGSTEKDADFHKNLEELLKVEVQKAVDYTLPKIMNLDGEHTQFEEIRELGSGACGDVFEFKYTVAQKGKRKASQKNYAVKMVKKASGNYHSEKTACDLQIRASPLLARFSDWHDKEKVEKAKVSQRFINTIVKTYDEDEHYFYIVMELGDKRNFSDLTDPVYGALKKVINDEENSKFYAACLLRAIEIIHTKNIAHRDIKPQNMVINPESGYLQLTDFGLAVESKGEDLDDQYYGTIGYMAPEQLTKDQYGKDVDWWAYGVTLYRLCAGEEPFTTEYETFQGLTECYEEELTESQWSDDGKDLIRKLLRVNPKERWNPLNKLNVREHPWFKDFDWDRLNSGRFPAPWKPDPNSFGRTQEETNGYFQMHNLHLKVDCSNEEF